ncbi:SDR family oxidoreductase [Nostoc flagelliforme]|uniref:SDR family oxidoreductase n=1 Tax=Nostoc flagelliforme TaxID=1306274 RepID=UPI001F55955F|nr:SDR family oxidoreductase [Nostoc flagelliforme]
MANIALIVGAGSGLSASLARLFTKEGFSVALAARQIDKLSELSDEIGAVSFAADASKPDQVEQLFKDVEQKLGVPTVVVYNPSWRVRGSLVELNPADVAKTLEITAYGGFLVAQAAAKRQLAVGGGAIFLQVLPPVLRVILSLHRLQWVNLLYGVWLKALPVNWLLRIST